MTQYKDPTRPIKCKQRHASGQNKRFIRAFLFFLLAGVTLWLISCTLTQQFVMQCKSKQNIKQSDYTHLQGNILGNVCGNAGNTQGNVLGNAGNVTSNTVSNNLLGYIQKWISPQEHFFKNRLLLAGVLNDNKALSNEYSDTPNRYPLAFFMPNISPASQAGDIDSITHLTPFTGLNRHIYAHSVTNYGGMTLQNITALGRICRAVTVFTESKSRHLLRNFRSNVVLTQKNTGGHNHA